MPRKDNVEGGPWLQLFLGRCFGVGLKKRGQDDPHIVFVVLCEDDGRWFPSTSGGSSYWIGELLTQLKLAEAWTEKNGESDTTEHGTYGYRVK